jgi:hypothetical protein
MSPRAPFLVREHILFGFGELTIFKVDVNNIGMPGQVGLGRCCKQGLERCREFKSLHKDTLGIIHKESHCEVGVKLWSSKCNKIVDAEAF